MSDTVTIQIGRRLALIEASAIAAATTAYGQPLPSVVQAGITEALEGLRGLLDADMRAEDDAWRAEREAIRTSYSWSGDVGVSIAPEKAGGTD